MNKKFNVGDKVRLKSGGAEMTVDEYTLRMNDKLQREADYKNVHCVWHDTELKEQRGTYDAEALELVS